MTLLTRAVRTLLLAAVMVAASHTVSPATARAQQKPQEPVGEFVPIDQLPPTEQMPAAPLVIGAYSFVMLALFFYLVSLSKRLGTVQREVERLESDLKHGKRP